MIDSGPRGPTHRPFAQLLSVQYLRAAAALGVVVYHAGVDADWADAWPLKAFAGGVDIFFVISGFIMWTTTYGRAIGPVEFWRRRVERIAPLYWLVTTVAVAVAVVSVKLGGATNAWHVVSSYLFLPANNPDTHRTEPLVSPGWTLNYEMFFYLVFGAALMFQARARAVITVVALVALVLGVRVVDDPSRVLEFYGNSIVMEFAFGLLLGALFTARGRFPIGLSVACLAVGLVLFGLIGSIADPERVIKLGVPALLVVGGAVMYERERGVAMHRLPKLLGDASYSLYLSHSLFIGILSAAWERTPVSKNLMVPVAIVGAEIVGVIVYLVVEKPITDYLRRRRSAAGRPPVTAPAVPVPETS